MLALSTCGLRTGIRDFLKVLSGEGVMALVDNQYYHCFIFYKTIFQEDGVWRDISCGF
jgi:hypothetical protein